MSTTISVEHNGETYPGTIMVIESTHLGMEDHGIATAFIHCKADSLGVGVGGFGLDRPVKVNGEFSHREGTGYGFDHLMQICRTVGVSRWEDLKGKHVIVLWSPESRGGWGASSVGIASLTGDRVFILKEHAEAWKEAHPEECDEVAF